MVMFGYEQYMQHAFPQDDLRPISCRGHDTQGGIANTLVDSLDTLLVRRRIGCASRCAGGGPVDLGTGFAGGAPA